jgi:hypothetical protein
VFERLTDAFAYGEFLELQALAKLAEKQAQQAEAKLDWSSSRPLSPEETPAWCPTLAVA